MSKIMRNPQTGRMMSKADTLEYLKAQETAGSEKAIAKATSKKKTKAVKPKVTAKVKNQKGEQKVQILVNPLAVYSKKAMEGNTSSIKAGTEVILTPVSDVAIRVKKTNSSRTFYTNKEAVAAAEVSV